MPPTNVSSSPVTTRTSWDPDLPAALGGSCAIHQPNLFPRLATLAKLFAADTWIVLDDVQFTRTDYQHRAKLAHLDDTDRRQWLSLATHLPAGRATLIQDARIAESDECRRRIDLLVKQYYRRSPHWAVIEQILNAVLCVFDHTDHTATVTEASTLALLDVLGWHGEVLHSSDMPSGTGRSERLADLATVIGADTYLCGTGGMRYLETEHFLARNIDVVPFRATHFSVGVIWDTSRQISALWALARLGPQVLADELSVVKAANRRTTVLDA